MKYLTQIIPVAAAILTCSITYADEHKDIDSSSVVAPVVEDQPTPNHLEPIPAYDPDGYDQAVFKSLLGNDPGEMWMIGMPSFSPEYAVILRHEVKYAPANDATDPFVKRVIESEKWVVEYVEAKKQIWSLNYLEDGKVEPDPKATKDVTRRRAEITHEFALTMIDAWRSILQQTRYPSEITGGLDGVTFRFYCNYNLFGQTWSPSSGVPLRITNLGLKLGEVAKAEVESRPPLIVECITLAKNLAPTKDPEQDAGGNRR